tara:strand:- start:707 stop:997 length:291 start_codon:yes stop_codon:yes gene_type:complete
MTQKEKIKDLEKQLEVAKRHTKEQQKMQSWYYVHETYRLHCNDGELYISHDDNKCVVFNVEQLYKDLPFIVTQVVKEQQKMQSWYLDNLKESLKEI